MINFCLQKECVPSLQFAYVAEYHKDVWPVTKMNIEAIAKGT